MRKKNALIKTPEYADIVGILNVAVFQTPADIKGRFIEVNPAMVAMFEAGSKKELLKHRVQDIYLDPEDRKRIIGKAVETGYLRNEEVRFKTLKGKEIWGSVTLVKMNGKRRKPFFSGIIEDITKHKQLEERLAVLSLEDDLTGIHNRRGFFVFAYQQHKTAIRHKLETTFVFIDLDNLKSINDTYGHTEGDKAVVSVAEALKRTCRESDIFGRIGGDEFAIFAVGIGEMNSWILIKRFFKNVETINETGTLPFKLSVSVGSKSCRPEEKCSLEEMLDLADKSMYAQKKESQWNAKTL